MVSAEGIWVKGYPAGGLFVTDGLPLNCGRAVAGQQIGEECHIQTPAARKEMHPRSIMRAIYSEIDGWARKGLPEVKSVDETFGLPHRPSHLWLMRI